MKYVKHLNKRYQVRMRIIQTEISLRKLQNEIDIDVANLPADPDYGYSITSYVDKSGNQGMF